MQKNGRPESEGSPVALRPAIPMAHGNVPEAGVGSGDRAYWLKREQDSRELAARASDDCVARIHLAMAERYAVLATECGQTPP